MAREGNRRADFIVMGIQFENKFKLLTVYRAVGFQQKKAIVRRRKRRSCCRPPSWGARMSPLSG